MIKNKIDKLNMRQVIIDSPDQLIKGLELAKDFELKNNYKMLLFAA
jgi:hypothetical protein